MTNYNILYIHRTQGRGVERVHINGIVGALRDMGNNVDVICPMEENRDGVTTSTVNVMSRLMPEIIFEIMEIVYNFAAYRKAKIHINTKKISFIYERFAFFSWTGMLLAKRLKAPLFLEVNYTTHTPLVRKRTNILMPLARYIENEVLNSADAIFVVSSFLKKQLIELGVSEKKIHLTVNAVDKDIFGVNYNSVEIKDKYCLRDTIVIGYVGGFYHWHELDLLLKAVKTVEREKNNLSLLLIGEGPDKSKLKDLYKKMGMHSKLIMPGEVEHKELPKYLNAMDICILPDTNNYCSPVKIFEYMAMGKPVIAPELDNIRDIIVDKINGILFKPKDYVELGNALELLLENKELYRKISVAAKEEIFKYHLWSNNAENILETYVKVVSNNA